MKIYKNCYNCKFLRWIKGNINNFSKYICIKRQYPILNYKKEKEINKNLTKESYRLKSKRCYKSRYKGE